MSPSTQHQSPVTYTSLATIRPSLERICSLFVEAFTTAPRYEVWTTKTAEKFIVSHLQHGGWSSCVFEAEHSVVAFTLSVPLDAWKPVDGEFHLEANQQPSLYLSTVVTAPESRHKGLAGKLLEFEETRATRLSYSSIVARTRTDTPEIIALLSKRGFSIVDKMSATIGDVSALRLLHLKLIAK